MMSGVYLKVFEYLKWSAPGATVINTRKQPGRHLININCDAASTMITNKGVPAWRCVRASERANDVTRKFRSLSHCDFQFTYDRRRTASRVNYNYVRFAEVGTRLTRFCTHICAPKASPSASIINNCNFSFSLRCPTLHAAPSPKDLRLCSSLSR